MADASDVPAAYAAHLPVLLIMTQMPTSRMQAARSIYQYCATNFSLDAWEALPEGFDQNDDYLQIAVQLCTLSADQDIGGVYTTMKIISDTVKTARLLPQQLDEQRTSSSLPAHTSYAFQTTGPTTRRTSAQIQRALDTDGVIPLQYYETFSSVWNGVGAKHVRRILKERMAVLVDKQDDFWKHWIPAPWGTADKLTQDHISSLRLFTVPHDDTLPDMLTYCLGHLHTLDPSVTARLEHLLKSDNNWYIKNASGTGKTRLILEALTYEWGLYFPCFWDDVVDPYGSHDLHEALTMLAQENRNNHLGRAFFDPLTDMRQRNRSEEQIRQTNNGIATHIFTLVLCARIVVLDHFLARWEAYATSKSLSVEQRRSTGMRLWCHLQINPCLSPTCSDIFSEVFNAILLVTEQDAVATIRNYIRRWDRYSWFDLKIIAFDEAQHASNLFPRAFPSGDSPDVSRPALRPLVIAIGLAMPNDFNLIVGGTKLGEEMIMNALTTALGKKEQTLDSFQELGDQSESASRISLLEHFFGKTYVQTIPAQLSADIQWWLPGRHRFISLLIQYTLRSGPNKLEAVLNTLIHQLTGGYVRQRAFTPVDNMHLHGVLSKSLIEADPDPKIRPIVQVIQKIVVSLVVGEGFPTLPDTYLDLVMFGIGRIVVAPNIPLGEPIVVDEPIILAALVQWLTYRCPDYNPFTEHLEANFDPTRPDGTKGALFEDMIAYRFWRSLRTPTRLSDVFDFGYLKPSWADETAELLSCMASFSPQRHSETMGEIMTSRLIFKAYAPESSLNWFKNQGVYRQPFLNPDTHFGPDLIFGLRLQSGREILVLVQCKCWQGKKKHGPKEVEGAVWKLSPENCYWHKDYKQSSEALTTCLDKAFLSHSVNMPVRPTPPAPTAGSINTSPTSKHTLDEDMGPKEWIYEAGNAKYPIIRVFATFTGSYGEITNPDLGPYPLAYLTNKFMEKATVDFKSFEIAINHAKEMSYAKKKASRKAPAPILPEDNASSVQGDVPVATPDSVAARKRTSSVRSNASITAKSEERMKRAKRGD